VDRNEGGVIVTRTIGKKDFPQLQPGPAKVVVTAARPVFYGVRHVASTASTDIQLRFDPQPRLRRRITDQVHDDGSRAERLTSPVLGDVAEHPVLDLVPLARAGREMADRDPQPQVVGQTLQRHFPQPRAISVTATGIGSDQESACPGIGR